jgi:membrane carboxypeptidase/penicillin-binding protein PbpC
MDKYLEKEEAKRMYFYHKMVERKQQALNRLLFISDDYDTRERFAQMMIDAEEEGVIYADEFIEWLSLDNIDKLAIKEEIDLFIQECIEENENNYAEDKYNG